MINNARYGCLKYFKRLKYPLNVIQIREKNVMKGKKIDVFGSSLGAVVVKASHNTTVKEMCEQLEMDDIQMAAKKIIKDKGRFQREFFSTAIKTVTGEKQDEYGALTALLHNILCTKYVYGMRDRDAFAQNYCEVLYKNRHLVEKLMTSRNDQHIDLVMSYTKLQNKTERRSTYLDFLDTLENKDNFLHALNSHTKRKYLFYFLPWLDVDTKVEFCKLLNRNIDFVLENASLPFLYQLGDNINFFETEIDTNKFKKFDFHCELLKERDSFTQFKDNFLSKSYILNEYNNTDNLDLTYITREKLIDNSRYRIISVLIGQEENSENFNSFLNMLLEEYKNQENNETLFTLLGDVLSTDKVVVNEQNLHEICDVFKRDMHNIVTTRVKRRSLKYMINYTTADLQKEIFSAIYQGSGDFISAENDDLLPVFSMILLNTFKATNKKDYFIKESFIYLFNHFTFIKQDVRRKLIEIMLKPNFTKYIDEPYDVVECLYNNKAVVDLFVNDLILNQRFINSLLESAEVEVKDDKARLDKLSTMKDSLYVEVNAETYADFKYDGKAERWRKNPRHPSATFGGVSSKELGQIGADEDVEGEEDQDSTITT